MTEEQKKKMAEGREAARLKKAQEQSQKPSVSPSDPPNPATMRDEGHETKPPVKAPDAKVFGLTPNEAAAFLTEKHTQEARKSLAAIEQAKIDAANIASNRVLNNPVTQALLADPGNIELRVKFLSELGPSKLVPDRPAPTAYGVKDPDLMRWQADYEPEEFLKVHGNGPSKLAKELTALVKSRLK